jgi:hypothetical protein
MSTNSSEAPSAPTPTYGGGGFLPKLEGEARDHALADPGPSWREWLLTSFASVWTLLGFLTLDIWGIVEWLGPAGAGGIRYVTVLGIVGTLVLFSYLEFLLWRLLYYRPSREDDLARLPFRRSWLLPVRFGIWTAEARRLKNGYDPFDTSH